MTPEQRGEIIAGHAAPIAERFQQDELEAMADFITGHLMMREPPEGVSMALLAHFNGSLLGVSETYAAAAEIRSRST